MNEIFKKSLVSVGKIIVAIILVYFTYLLLLVKTRGELIFGICLLIFITIPTFFVVFLKTNKIFKIIYIVILALFVMGMVFAFYRAIKVDRTQSAVEFINSQKITLDDVMGKNLPPQPDQKLNDSTVAGIDVNKNGIRDDVELAIFKKHPNSARIRAAELQYAKALQLELTQVFNSETLVAAIIKEDLAYNCIGNTSADLSLSALNMIEKELNDDILNTSLRKNEQLNDLKKYMTSYSLPSSSHCDVELSLLSD